MIFKNIFEILLHFFHKTVTDYFLIGQFHLINFAHIVMRRNGFIELWLGKTRFVTFVVSVFAITQQVNEYIRTESVAVIYSESHSVNYGFHIVGIDMHHRIAAYFSHISTIRTGTTVQIIGGKSDLIVDYDVNRSSGFITVQRFHLNDFVHNALSGNSSIPVNIDGKDFFEIIFVIQIYFST